MLRLIAIIVILFIAVSIVPSMVKYILYGAIGYYVYLAIRFLVKNK